VIGVAERDGGAKGKIMQKAASAEVGKGSIGSGIVAFATRIVLFVILPSLVIELLCSVARRSSSGGAPAFASALQQLPPELAAVGIPLAILAGIWGYHLRRTPARLFFGLLMAFVLALYSAVLFLSGPFGAAVDALGWFFPPALAFGVGAYMSARVALRSFREYHLFGGSGAATGDAKERHRPALGWGEFDLRAGSIAPGAAEAMRCIAKTINAPVLALLFFMGLLSALTFGQTDAETFFLQVLAGMAGIFLLVGVPLTTMAFLKGYYPRGSRPRTVFDLASSLLLILMIFWLFVWSGLQEFFLAEGLEIPVDVIALSVAIWAFVDVLRVGAEYYEERGEWLRRNGYEAPPRERRYLGFPPGSMLYDFNLALGKLSRGLKGARKDVLRFVTLPEILILLAIGMLKSLQEAALIIDILKAWALSVMLFGLLVAFVAFWRAYYPPGSWSRLAMGLLLMPMMGLYILALGLGGEFNEDMKQMGVFLYMPGIQMLLAILVIFVGFRQVAEFGDHHHSWLVACGKKARPIKPIAAMSRIQEFRPRFGSRHNGAVWAGKGMVRYVFYTSFVIIFIITLIDSAVFARVGLDLSPLANGLSQAFLGLILIAIPLAAFRALYGFYPSGSTSKLAAGYLMGATGASYTFTAFHGGSIMLASKGPSLSAGLYIDFGFVVVLFSIGWIIWGVFVTIEYLGYRKAWVANGYAYPADVDEQLKLQKMFQKEERRAEKLEERESRRALSKAHKTSVDAEGNAMVERSGPDEADEEEEEEDAAEG
jgi:hypothetical protein